jgi:L-threonylcarbamoyladenylate synthase
MSPRVGDYDPPGGAVASRLGPGHDDTPAVGDDEAVGITATALDDAARILRQGGLVAFPTETVYGLGADAANPVALRRLYAVKRRPASHPVIVHLATGSPAGLAVWADPVTTTARTLAETCWPGPVTLVLRRAPGVPDEVTGGRDTVGLRVPDQPVAHQLLARFGGGVAAPSANRFGRVSPTTAAHVRADLGTDVDLVIDDGPCRVGLESTVVDCTADEPVILRQGALAREDLEAILHRSVDLRTDGSRAAPGTLDAHYAPNTRVVLVTDEELGSRAKRLLAEGKRVGVLTQHPGRNLPQDVEVLDASPDVDELAHQLYSLLRDADRRQLDVLLAVPPPPAGLGAAVTDRLTRAAFRPTPERAW